MIKKAILSEQLEEIDEFCTTHSLIIKTFHFSFWKMIRKLKLSPSEDIIEMESNNKNILVLGLGSEILMDDGIAPKLTKILSKKHNNKQIKFEISSVGGLDILEMIRDYHTIIIIDSIKTRNGKPGDVYYFTPSDYKETLHLSNIHDVSFLNALKMGKEIGINIPEIIRIIAIEIVEDTVFGNSFTDELNKRFQEITQSVENYIIQFVKN